MSFLLINLAYRAIGYVATPVVAGSVDWVDERLNSVSPETRKHWTAKVLWLLRPLFIFVDWLRLGLVRAYVHDSKCFKAVKQYTDGLNSLVQTGRPVPLSVTWTKNDERTKHTTPTLSLVLWAFAPLFFAADISRSWAVSNLYPESSQLCEDYLNSLWSNMFGKYYRYSPVPAQ